MQTFTFIVSAEDKGERLDSYLAHSLDNITRSRVKNLIDDGAVSVCDKVVKKSGYTLKESDFISISFEEPTELKATPEDLPIDIVYQDADFLVINKAQGMVTHPATGSPSGTLVNALLYHVKDLSGINGVLRPGIVHRLDKDTSGLIMVAKNDKAHLSLSAQIAEKSAKRYYIALVDGNIKEDEGIINQPIARHRTERKKMAVDKDGRVAKTAFKVLERFKNYTLVEYELFTGRTHQIRVHSSYIHHPVVGDPVYGGSNKFHLDGQLLHAFKLELTHPSTGERMTFEAKIPDYFEKVLEKIRKTLA
ncbi:MAG: RluA family pseudouridine synthase [Clostridia bacterium]|nr:RluA family pseudouridine synthase [Clostridia bacterium]MBR3684905.1 RluA family pseudouridine synthase [Clostridia bacterium]